MNREQFDSLRYLGKMENWRNHPSRVKAISKLVNLGMKISTLTDITAEARYDGARSTYDVNVKNFWTVKEGLVSFSPYIPDQSEDESQHRDDCEVSPVENAEGESNYNPCNTQSNSYVTTISSIHDEVMKNEHFRKEFTSKYQAFADIPEIRLVDVVPKRNDATTLLLNEIQCFTHNHKNEWFFTA